jgi:hypothetical protein
MTRQLRNSIVIALATLLASAGAWAAFTRPGPASAAVFEVRAIDAQGHPVAGAEVWLENGPKNAQGSGQQVGVTDSFGIWRRNLKLPAGTEARFNFRKKVPVRRPGGVVRDLTAFKTFQIGPAGQKRAENHKGSVKLEPARI